MTEETKSPEEQPPAEEPKAAEEPAAAPAAEETPAADAKEVEEGKVFGILSYALGFVGVPFFLIPLIMRNNGFSLYHAKQCLVLWLLAIAGSVVSAVLSVVCIGVILGVVLAVFCLVLNIMGLMNAIRGEQKPLPLIGQWGEQWFKGLKKA